ncbi:esterase E4-like [Penaeus japonicus]|uniref:esterase E4-like n=1 Tax=Penaeus japonicus TaxID=27405 RepID=UPI001C70F36D|nr:esterase E4-like [Penaeus japonicus]XP_042892372.1 esterase E4-like [Penaeus japonicus]
MPPSSSLTHALFVASMGFIMATCGVASQGTSPSMAKIITAGSQPDVWTPIQHTTSLGTVSGRKEETIGQDRTHTHYYAFRGIPFAEPPVGELRWSDPVESKDRWPGGHLDASEFRSPCPQYDTATNRVLGDEDCLYLNVFTPKLPDADKKDHEDSKDLLPVFVFIHGGAFLRGSAVSHGASRLLANDLVLVTVNYRLGALGFLSTGDATLAGNYGMLDQEAALRWVERNIGQFGGDKNRVTIGGFSAGAASVHLHSLSPRSEGLFHGAVLMSGSGMCSWAVREKPRTHAHRFARELGCPYASSADLKSCVLSKSMEEVVEAQAKMHRYIFWPVPFSVVVDGGLRERPFLPVPVENLTPRAPVPVLMGMVPNEGLLFSLSTVLTSKNSTDVAGVYEDAARYLVASFLPESTADTVARLAESLYYTPKARRSLDTLVEEMTEALTDYLFLSCVWDTGLSYSNGGSRVYTYVMTHRVPETYVWADIVYQKARGIGITTPLLDVGISHGDEMLHIFSFPGAPELVHDKSPSPKDDIVAAFMTSAWASFVMHGEPRTNPTWEPLAPGEPQPYMNLSLSPAMVHSPFKKQSQNFWRQSVPLVTNSLTTGLRGSPAEHCLRPPAP